MKLNEYIISLIFCGVLLITSFIPIVQVILMYWNGGILALEDLIGIETLDTISLNLIFTIISLLSISNQKYRNENTLCRSDNVFHKWVNNSDLKMFFGTSDGHFMLGNLGALLLTGLGLLRRLLDTNGNMNK
jgi:predicted signal transduction protein with EAL and GGDEF domain